MPQSANQHVSRRSFVQSLAALGIGVAGMPAMVRATGAGGGFPSVGLAAEVADPYVFAHLTAHPGSIETLVALLGGMKPFVHKYGGWTLHGSYLQITDHAGPHTAVIDVWEMPDADPANDLAGMTQDPEFAPLLPLLQECVAGEVLKVMRKLPVKIPSWDETAEPSPTFMFAHVTLKPGMVDTFTEMLGDVAPIFHEHRGWKLRGSYLQLEGSTDTDTAIDVWEVPGINAIVTNLNASREDAAYKKLQPVMRECVAGEVQQVMTKLPVRGT